jgi:hypothetical protein
LLGWTRTNDYVSGSGLLLNHFCIIQAAEHKSNIWIFCQDWLSTCLISHEEGVSPVRVGVVEVGEGLATDVP